MTEERGVLAARRAQMELIKFHAEVELSTLEKLESVMNERDYAREKLQRVEKLVESWQDDDDMALFTRQSQVLRIVDEGE